MTKKDNIKRHYKLTDNTIEVDGHVLHQIICTESFDFADEGDLGGFIEGYQNLEGNGWVRDEAMVYGGAVVRGRGFVAGAATVCNKSRVFGNAKVYGHAYISGHVEIYGNASVSENATISWGQCDDTISGIKIGGETKIGGQVLISTQYSLLIDNAFIFGDAVIESKHDWIVFKNWWSSGRFFTWTRSNDMWSVGCFYGTGKELIVKAYKDSEISGREYKRVVKYVEGVKKADKPTILQRLKKFFS